MRHFQRMSLPFQSTPSVGRATCDKSRGVVCVKFQSTPSVGRATFEVLIQCLATVAISIHALRGEGDLVPIPAGSTIQPLFQSTPSVGRATKDFLIRQEPANISIHALRGEGDDDDRVISVVATISIHALRGEGDSMLYRNGIDKWDFNPRPPWGGRRFAAIHFFTSRLFQSTPSVGRATRAEAMTALGA